MRNEKAELVEGVDDPNVLVVQEVPEPEDVNPIPMKDSTSVLDPSDDDGDDDDDDFDGDEDDEETEEEESEVPAADEE